MDPPNPRDITPGLTWHASSRYNNQALTDSDLRAFYDRAARDARVNPPPPDSDAESSTSPRQRTIEISLDPSFPAQAHQGPRPARLDSQSPRTQTPSTPVHPPRQISPTRLRRLYDLYGIPADTPLEDPATPEPRLAQATAEGQYLADHALQMRRRPDPSSPSPLSRGSPAASEPRISPRPSASGARSSPVASETRTSPRPSPSRSPRARGRLSSTSRLPTNSNRTLPTRSPTRNVSRGSLSNATTEGVQGDYGVKEHVYCKFCADTISASQTIQGRRVEGSLMTTGVAIFAHDNEEGESMDVFRHHPNFGALRQSALDGCHLCSLLAGSDLVASDVPDSVSYAFGVVSQQSYDHPGWIEIRAEGYNARMTSLSYDRSARESLGTLASRRTDTGEVFTLAKSWLNTCLGNHERCRASSNPDFLPTRLLKIATCDSFLLSIQLCLTDTAEFDPPPPYLALSHCWGGARIIRLLTSTLTPFLTNIPLASLPQNFTDAALATAKLGFTYLWIDSLCIIQDDAADWAREAATMGSVYSNATLTIAALGAKDSHGGCFVTRNPLSFLPCLLSAEDGRPSVWAGNTNMIRGPDSEGEMRPPLHRRGWVVQERALAPRTLSFGSQMVFWDCIEGLASEAKPELILKRSSAMTVSAPPIKSTLHELKELVRSKDWTDWGHLWWNLVRRYTECRLTMDADKWVAFSGLADAVEESARSRLYHGLWECNIFDELLWRADTPGRRMGFEAPSWSWLSIDEGVMAQSYNYEKDFRRVATVYIPPSKGLAAGVPFKKLSVRGRMLRMRWTVSRLGHVKWEYQFILQDGHKAYKTGADGVWYPDMKPDDAWELWTLQFVTSKWRECYGLVVTPVDDEKKTWERVGFYGMNWPAETGADANATQRYFGEIETITLV